MRISVTQDHIKKGRKASCGHCPIALALKDAGLKDISVESHHVTIHNGRKYIENGKECAYHRILVPYEVTHFIYDFDNGRKVETFEFELDYIP
jgi:hypothetical protein